MARPNVVFAFADQLRAQTTGFGGCPQVQTPNMDRMAERGVVFENTVSNIPVGTPWRAAFLTGQYPLSNGIFLNDLPLSGRVPTLGTIFREAGYKAGYIGKWHLDGPERSAFTPPGPRRQGFDFWMVGNCTHDYFHSIYYRDTPEPLYWNGYDAEEQTTAAIDFIRSHDRKMPFALVVSWAPLTTLIRRYPSDILTCILGAGWKSARTVPIHPGKTLGVIMPASLPWMISWGGFGRPWTRTG